MALEAGPFLLIKDKRLKNITEWQGKFFVEDI